MKKILNNGKIFKKYGQKNIFKPNTRLIYLTKNL